MCFNSFQECHVCSSVFLVSFRSGGPEISSIQSRENAELVEEKGTHTCCFSEIAHGSVLFFPTVFEPCVCLGRKDCGCTKKEEHLCGRRSQVHNVHQSKDRVRLQRG